MSMISYFSKVSGWYRLLTVVSIIWVITALIVTDPWTRISSSSFGRRSFNNWNDFLLSGILPVVILWGIVWVVQGFKKRKES